MIMTLIKKSDFDAMPAQNQKEMINASTSFSVSDFPVYSLSSADWYLIEADQDKALLTHLRYCEFFNSSQMIKIIKSGVYTPAVNKVIEDEDGAPFATFKIAPKGWSYHAAFIEFETCNLSSIYNHDQYGDNLNHSTVKVYKTYNSTAQTEVDDQADADLNGVATVVDWMPPFDIFIVGGAFRQLALPVQDLRLYAIGAPDLPVELGGQKAFICCANVKYIGLEESLKADGKAPKKMPYMGGIGSNKMRFIFTHPAGFKHKGQLLLEVYRP